jgi:hypothetical protein
MMRTISVEIGGVDWAVPASYRVASDLCLLGLDPLKIALSARDTGELNINLEQLIDIIHIGIKRAGCQMTRDDVGEAVISQIGIVPALEKASEILTALVAGGPSSKESNPSPKKPSAARRKPGPT